MTDLPPKEGEILDDNNINARDTLSANLANLWWTFLLRGILAGLIGIAALFWPTSSISLLLRLVGLLLILDGALTWLGFGRRGLVGGVGIGAAPDRIGAADLAARRGLAGFYADGGNGAVCGHRFTDGAAANAPAGSRPRNCT